MSHGEAARLFFLPPSTSKANHPKIVIQIKHPVNCTHPTSHLHCPSHVTDLQRASVYSPEVAPSIKNRLRSLRYGVAYSLVYGVWRCDTIHGHLSNIHITDSREGRSHVRVSKHMPPKRRAERENPSSSCMGTVDET